MLRLDTLRATPIQPDPFEHVIVKDFIERAKLQKVLADYPEVPGPGSHPPSSLKIAGGFRDLIDEMLDAPFRNAVEEKFAIDLTGRPTMYTVRGFLRRFVGEFSRPPAPSAERFGSRKLCGRDRACWRDPLDLQALG
jgi:hypothetical protein